MTVRPLVRVGDQVYCTAHGGIHDETDDPYNYGDPPEQRECSSADWRPVYWRARKGDDPS